MKVDYWVLEKFFKVCLGIESLFEMHVNVSHDPNKFGCQFFEVKMLTLGIGVLMTDHGRASLDYILDEFETC